MTSRILRVSLRGGCESSAGLESRRHFALLAGLDDDFAEGGAFLLVVFVELDPHRSFGVGRLPAPFANRDKLQGRPVVPRQAGALAACEKFIPDSDISCNHESRESVVRDGRGRLGFGF